MNTDIRLKLSFRNHPKTKKLAMKLGTVAPLNFIWLLMFVAESKPDGRLTNMDADDVAIAAGWEGCPEQFSDILVQLRLLDQDADGTLVVHDWDDNNPWAAGANARSERAKKAAAARWSDQDSQKHAPTNNQQVTKKTDATSINEHSGKHDTALHQAQKGNAPSPSPIPKPIPDPKPKPENQKHLGDAGAPPDRPAEKPKIEKPATVDERFEEIWAARPGRPNDPKHDALKAYRARIKEGIDHAVLLAGVERYRRYIEHEGKAPQFTKRLSTFLGPAKHWAEPWDLIEKVPDDLDGVRRLVAENAINLPDNCQLREARKLVSRALGMSL